MKDQHGNKLKRIQRTKHMDDETFMKHLEHRHGHELKMKFTTEPGQDGRVMRERKAWESFHAALHRIWTTQNNHWHGSKEEEEEDDD